MHDQTAATFGLPPCLRIPIAADSVDALRLYVGRLLQTTMGNGGRINAVLIQPYDRIITKHPGVKLWTVPRAAEYAQRLHPPTQVWVHVDYSGYRQAYQSFGQPPIPAGYFLDHVQNRAAIRLRGYTHPYLRLCPVSRQVNTSGGVNAGGEGMEKEYLRDVLGKKSPAVVKAEAVRVMRRSRIIYADPMDLTKMLDIPPGTGTLQGVASTQDLFFPKQLRSAAASSR